MSEPQLTLRIGNVVEFPVTLVVNDSGAEKKFKFKFLANRISANEWMEHFTAWRKKIMTAGTADGDDFQGGADLLVDDFTATTLTANEDLLLKNIIGWSEQTLVIDNATSQPAEFSEPGLRLVLGLFQSIPVIRDAYIDALGIKDGRKLKDERSKN